MRAAIQIARVKGIPIRIHVTFLLILPLLAAILGASFRGVPFAWAWGLGVAVALFASVLVHELAHTFYALRQGGTVADVTLLMIGGVSRITRMPPAPRHEAGMALVGPLTSLGLGAAFLGAAAALRPLGLAPLHHAALILGQLNIVLGIFNLLPAFPMDGGRIVRALLTPPLGRARATQVSGTLGKVFAALFALLGLATMNLILLAVAFFVYAGADAETKQVLTEAALEGVTVGEVMSGPPPILNEQALGTLALEEARHARSLAVAVRRPGEAPDRYVLRSALQSRLSRGETDLSLSELARPLERVGPSERLLDVLRRLEGERPEVLGVSEGDQLVGMITGADVARAASERLPARRGGGLWRRAPAHS